MLVHYNYIRNEVIRDLSIVQNTKEKFSKIWFDNYVHNLKYVFESVDVGKLINKFRTIPAVIVSAGPSLNQNVKSLKNKALIICVGTAVYSDRIISSNEITEKKKLKIKGVNDNELITNIVFYKFLRCFEKEINNDGSDRVYINAIEGGAYIKGTLAMTLEEVLDKYLKCRIDIDYIIQEIYIDRNTISKQDFILTLEDLKSIINRLRDLSYSFEKGIEKLGDQKALLPWILNL